MEGSKQNLKERGLIALILVFGAYFLLGSSLQEYLRTKFINGGWEWVLMIAWLTGILIFVPKAKKLILLILLLFGGGFILTVVGGQDNLGYQVWGILVYSTLIMTVVKYSKELNN